MDAMSEYEMRNDSLWVTIDTLGATLRRLRVRDGDGWCDLALCSDDTYMGRTCGRFANRLAGGKFEIDGVKYQVTINEPPNTLHGGVQGFSDADWEVVSVAPDEVALRLVSPDGDQGFPGKVEAAAVFSLGANTLTVSYAATCDRSTIVSLTLHPYFNMGLTPDIDDLILCLRAPEYTPTFSDGIPTGDVMAVDGTGLDFTSPRRMGEARAAMIAQHRDRGGAMDHNFIIPGEGIREVARLIGNGHALSVFSDAPYVMIYDAAGFDGTHIGLDGQPYGAHAGVAIEPQSMPDAPNQQGFGDTVLRPGQIWSRTISFMAS